MSTQQFSRLSYLPVEIDLKTWVCGQPGKSPRIIDQRMVSVEGLANIVVSSTLGARSTMGSNSDLPAVVTVRKLDEHYCHITRHMTAMLPDHTRKIAPYLIDSEERGREAYEFYTDFEFGFWQDKERGTIVLRLCRSVNRNDLHLVFDKKAAKDISAALSSDSEKKDFSMFHFDRWFVGALADNGDIRWYNDRLKNNTANFDEKGDLHVDGRIFKHNEWPWPEAAWRGVTPAVDVYLDLKRILKPSDDSPLSAIIRSSPAYRALGLQISRQIKDAMGRIGPRPKDKR